MILSRLVNPRASRKHDIVASVPLLTIRTFSIAGIQVQISSASSTSNGFGIPKLSPRCAASHTALTILDERVRESPAPSCRHNRSAPDHRSSRCASLGHDRRKRLPTHAAKRAHRRVHATGDPLLRASKSSAELPVICKGAYASAYLPAIGA